MIIMLFGCWISNTDKTPSDQAPSPSDELTEETGLNTPTLMVTLSAEELFNDSILFCNAEFSGSEEIEELSFRWFVEGTEIIEGDVLQLSPSFAMPKDSFKCEATATVNGEEIVSEFQGVIQNRKPVINGIQILPAHPIEGVHNLNCSVDVTDPDTNSLVLDISWIVNSAPYTGQTIEDLFPGDTVKAGETTSNEIWECHVVANDGIEMSNSANATTQIINGCGYGNCDLSINLFDGTKIDMNLITSGSDPLGRYNLTNDFYMMTTETTQAMFIEVMNYDPADGLPNSPGVGDNYPAKHINWDMAADFANNLTTYHNEMNEMELSHCYTCSNSGTNVNCTALDLPTECSGFRLPTDAEWEYATRSRTTASYWTGQGSALGGNASSTTCSIDILDGVTDPSLSLYAWFCGNSDSELHPVAEKLPNGFGLYDLHGNAFEWVEDDYGCLFPETPEDPVCKTNAESRVLRGGNITTSDINLKSSARGWSDHGTRDISFGFRLVWNSLQGK